jgi:hypothetical protein
MQQSGRKPAVSLLIVAARDGFWKMEPQPLLPNVARAMSWVHWTLSRER